MAAEAAVSIHRGAVLLTCAYCDRSCQQTREHVIPRWYNDTPGEGETFSARAPLTHIRGDLIVKDVCPECNSGRLSSLDAYGKELYERYFAHPVYLGETVNFHCDGDRLRRWLLKVSYNSARAQNADVRVLREYRQVILGESPLPDRIRCWLHLVTPTWFDPEAETARPARREEQGHAKVEEPLWFRVGQFRLRSHPTLALVQRTVLINSYAFTLLIAPIDLAWPSPDVEDWTQVFASIYPEAKPIVPGLASMAVTAHGDHAIASVYPLFASYPSRFSDEANPFVIEALKSAKDGAPVVLLHITPDLIESGETTSVASALHHMVSTRENAAAFKQRVGLMVDGFDADPRGLWQIPQVRQFFRQLFEQCPFVMFVAHPDGDLLKLLAACWVYEDADTEEGQKQRMDGFLTRAFEGLNSLGHCLPLSEEQNRDICMTATKVLLGDAPQGE